MEIAALDLDDMRTTGGTLRHSVAVSGTPVMLDVPDAIENWVRLRGRWAGPFVVPIAAGRFLGRRRCELHEVKRILREAR